MFSNGLLYHNYQIPKYQIRSGIPDSRSDSTCTWYCSIVEGNQCRRLALKWKSEAPKLKSLEIILSAAI